MKQVVIYLLMVEKLLNSEQNILKLQHISCVQETFQRRSVDNTKETELKGYVYDFRVDYNAIAVADILYIHKYLMKINGIA